MAYGTLNAGAITPGSGNTLTVSEAVTFSGAVNLGTPSAGVVTNLSGTLANSVQDNITRLGTVTAGNLSNTSLVYPAGHVIQTVYFSNDYEQVITGTTATQYIESSSGTTWIPYITLSSTSNHIILIANIFITGGATAVQDNRASLYIEIDKAGAGYNEDYNGRFGIGIYDFGNSGLFSNFAYNPSYRSSPGFAGQCNFKFGIAPNNTGGQFKVNYPSTAQQASVILMEIKG